jgi:Multiubiquitin
MTHQSQNEGLDDDKKPKDVTVEVNSKEVVLTEKIMTGLEIKRAAIQQHVQIQEDFILQLEKHNGEFDTIGDDDTVHSKKGMHFTCIAPDDNS